MDWMKTDVLTVLYFLLPGFLAASIFYSLTAHPKKDAFERVIQALIFTIIIKAMNIGLMKLWWVTWHKHHPYGQWTPEKELVGSLLSAVVLGFVLAVIVNWDFAHLVLRKCSATKRTSYPSEWYSGFHRFRRELILHLTGDRRLKGWADEWPDQCDKGHFLLQSPEWLDDAGKVTPFSQVKRLLIRAEDVEMVEFLCTPEELPKSAADIIAEQKPLVELHLKNLEKEHGKPEQSEAGPAAKEDSESISKSTPNVDGEGPGEC